MRRSATQTRCGDAPLAACRRLGPIRIAATDRTPRLLGNSTHQSFEGMLRSAHFGFAPRGDARFSYRFSELTASAVLPITFNDWALPFHQLIDWHAIGIVLNASVLDRRVEQASHACILKAAPPR